MPSNRPRRKPTGNLTGAKRRSDGNVTSAAACAPRSLAPDAAQPLPAVFLKTPTFHPIVYRKRVAKVDSSAKAGELVAVYHGDEELLGYGIYNSRSEIAVR